MAITGFISSSSVSNFYTDIITLGLDSTLECCLDAAAVASYPGTGQTLFDLTSNDNDFWLGGSSSITGTDPTFTGIAGDGSGDTYFALDGGDYFTIKTNDTWVNNFHKNNADFTILQWVYFPNTSSASYYGLFGSSSWTISTPELGVYQIWNDNINYTKFNCTNDSGGARSAEVSTFYDMNLEWALVGVVVDEAAGTGFFVKNDETSTFTSTYSSPSTASATHSFNLMATGGGELPNRSGCRWGGAMIFTSSLSSAQVANIYNQTKIRYGL